MAPATDQDVLTIFADVSQALNNNGGLIFCDDNAQCAKYVLPTNPTKDQEAKFQAAKRKLEGIWDTVIALDNKDGELQDEKGRRYVLFCFLSIA